MLNAFKPRSKHMLRTPDLSGTIVLTYKRELDEKAEAAADELAAEAHKLSIY
jgi:hypothetical protein